MNTLILGDSLKVMQQMIDENKKVDYILTSPPYNRKRNDKYAFYDDTLNDYFGFLCNSIDLALKITNNSIFFNVQANYYNKQDIYKFIGHYYKEIQQTIVWEKSNPLPAQGFNITNAYEYIFVLGKNIKSNTTYTKNHITTSINTHTSKEHKAIMNHKVSDWIIEKFTQPNDTILDPFMGFGTTGVSCVKYNRNFIGIEINKQYYDEANKRINASQNIL